MPEQIDQKGPKNDNDIPDDFSSKEIVETMIRVHDKSPELRQIMSEAAPIMHTMISIIRAKRLLYLAIPLFLISIYLLIFQKGAWLAVGTGGVVASLLHFGHLAMLIRREKALGNALNNDSQ